MKKWLEDLLALQELDIRLRNLGTRVKLLPGEMKNLKQELEDAKSAVLKAKENVQKTELLMKKCEANIQAENDEICRLGAQTNLVKKNDEYNALLREIEHHKERISDFETEEIELMDALDNARKEYEELEKDFVFREKGLKEDMQEIVDLANDLKVEIAKVNEERSKRAKVPSQDDLSIYNRLLSKGKGSPLSELIEDNCGNCHMRVVPQVVNSVQKGERVSCNNCGFLLYSKG